MSDLEDFLNRLRERRRTEYTVRAPGWHLNKDGQQIEAIFEDVSYYGKYCGPRMVTLHANDDDRIVGVVLEGTPKVWSQCSICHYDHPHHEAECPDG